MSMDTEMDFLKRNDLTKTEDGVYFLDTSRKITYWSKECERITGFTQEEVLGKCCSENILKHVDHEGKNLCEEPICPVAQCMKSLTTKEANVFFHHKEGYRVPVFVRASPIKDGRDVVTGAVEAFRENYDAFSLRSQIQELEANDFLDALTRIGNRKFGEAKLDSVLYQFEENRVPFGVLKIDVDHLKLINDEHGNDAGDKTLKMVAQTLIHNIQPSDYAVRWDGEEFMVLIVNVDAKKLWAEAGKSRLLVAASDIEHNRRRITTTISVGAAGCEKGDTAEKILARANQLLQKSKKLGGNCLSLSYGEIALSSKEN